MSILDNCTHGGCGAKISPGELSLVLGHIAADVGAANDSLLVDIIRTEDLNAAIIGTVKKRSNAEVVFK